jgi:hypothetical protein
LCNTQGQQHYVTNKYLHNESSVDERKNADSLKAKLCKENGITLVQIPHWWDRKHESLASTLWSQRPELFQKLPMGTPIPVTEPPAKQKTEKRKIMLATEWEAGDPTGW